MKVARAAILDRTEVLGKIASLRQRIAAARAQSIAVCADATATLARVRRARAARHGVPYAPESEPAFIPEHRSAFRH